MATKVVLSKLSPTMEEGLIVKWIKNEGDAIRVGDVLAEVETDKANMEMEALATGVLRRIFVKAGQKAPVAGLIAVIAGQDEDISAFEAQAEKERSAEGTPAAAAAAPKSDAPPSAPPPSAAQPAPKPAPVATNPPSPMVMPAVTQEGRVKASPLAKKIAAEKHLAIEEIPGSGPGGRVVRRDVEAFVPSLHEPRRFPLHPPRGRRLQSP